MLFQLSRIVCKNFLIKKKSINKSNTSVGVNNVAKNSQIIPRYIYILKTNTIVRSRKELSDLRIMHMTPDYVEDHCSLANQRGNRQYNQIILR